MSNIDWQAAEREGAAVMAAREAAGTEALAVLIDDWHPDPDHYASLGLAHHLRGNGVRNPGDPLAPRRIRAAALRDAAERMRGECRHEGSGRTHCLARADDLDQWAAEYLAAIPQSEGGAPDA